MFFCLRHVLAFFLVVLIFPIPSVMGEPMGPRVIKVVMDDNYPPFVFQDGSGRLQGILIDQWRLWERKTGIRAEISAMDWSEAQHRMEAGDFDVIDTIFKTERRAGIYDFTKPYQKIEVPVFFHRDISGIVDAKSLSGFPVAAKAGDAAVDLLKKSGVTHLLLFKNYEAIIRAAQEHKVNVFVVDKPPALYFLNKLAMQDRFRYSPPLNTGEFHRAVRKGNAALLKTVEAGFAAITPGEYKAIETKWYGTELAGGRYLPYLIYVAVFAGLLVVALFIWNRMLSGAVEKRTAALKTSEQRFQTIFDSVNDAVFIHDPDSGAILDVNRKMCEMYGYSRAEALQLSIEDISSGLPPYNQAEAPAWIRGAAKDKPQLFEWQCKNREGRLFWVEVNMRLARIGAGDYVLVTARDISERRRAADELRATRDYLDSIINSIADPVFVKDSQHRLVLVNEAECALAGSRREDLIGKTDYDFFPAEQVDVFRRTDDLVLESGEANINEEVITDASGRTHTIVTHKSRYVDPDGNRFIVGVIRDVTERKMAEDQRRELERRLLHSQKLESLGVLAGGVAHDFNNLLMAILGNLDLALVKLFRDSPSRTNIELAVKAARHAAELTNTMLAYSGKGSFVIRDVNLSGLVEENVAMLRAAISKNITLELNLDKQIPHITADPAQIQQVIMNLITNASESIGDGAGTVTIGTGAQECDDFYLSGSRIDEKPSPGRFVYLEVSDTGCGMDVQTQQRLFDPFFTTKFTGRGLGTSAVLGIVRGHGGAIMVESEVGRGTAIRVLLPVATGDQGTRRIETGSPDPAVRGTAAFSGTILVIDDEDVVRQVCVAMVEALGFKAVEARDGEEAVRIFQDRGNEIDLILIDLTMPRMDGVATSRELRRIRPDVRIVLSSGFNEQDVNKRFAEQKLSGFVQKPYSIHSLEEVLKRAMADSAGRM
jgi:PAS domain S-box-containing protein